eukprot:gnl/TRDRNA2_/TRDRNA2_145041_c0_seq2.p1 gnl/TRDRNA2_/TRDRNA2_145041_c0~~gnl/TRDRNA2_/TRDRNA2_145041_c0_seq2.p1  ORF type:complete len:187 (-),score=33.13 gnl/TRDRNA2_/TRDRNA2_145041_c0_seq2:91-651(-)
MANVFVRGFDFGTDEAMIKKHCSKAGRVTSIEMQGKGSAVVTFANATSAEAAVDMLNQTTIPGNARYVEVKMNDENKGTKRGSPGSARVFVRGFDFGTTDEQFEGHMSQAGTIERVQWCTKGSAVVTFSSKAEAETAISTLNATTIPGNSRYIDVKLSDGNEWQREKWQKGAGKGFGKGFWGWGMW